MSVYEFFTNKGDERTKQTAVTAPAFSITKVLALLGLPVSGTLGSVAAELGWIEFTSGQLAGILIALIGATAIVAVADVLGRSWATAADKAASARLQMVRFDQSLPAKLVKPKNGKPLEQIQVVAASNAMEPEFLCMDESNQLRWRPANQVELS